MEADARAIAAERVAALAPRFPDLGLPEFDRTLPAMARAIEQEVRRRWLTLAAVCEATLDRGGWHRLEPRLQAVLLVGATQLLFFDEEPDHAVVDSAVGWASRRIRRGAGGLANAVLRKIADARVERLAPGDAKAADFEASRRLVPRRDGSAITLAIDVFAEEPIERLAAQTSHGRELLLHWTNAHGYAAARSFAAHGLVTPPTIVGGEAEELAGEMFTPHRQPGFAVFCGELSSLAEVLAARPSSRVQDPASAIPVASTASLRPDRILDLCAGRGTKTRQLAALHPDATIFAVEPAPARRADLEAMAATRPNIKVIDHADLPSLAGLIDLAVLDVPCSNTAVLPRRPEAKYRFSRRRLEGLIETQRSIAAAAAPLLAESAAVLYATCSLEPAENERQSSFIASQLGMRSVVRRLVTPQGRPGGPPAEYADGGFHDLLQR